MRIGATFPQTEIGSDPAAIRDYAQAVEDMGYTHILAYDHVIGANAGSRPGWSGPYTNEHPFHEIFVLLGYLAGVTTAIELVTGIVILPQRQTVLAAKQAAAIDVLSGGRLRLGVGVGWNPVEYEALGEDFSNRGRRQEEQIDVMRRLWTNDLVTFDGTWHRITDAGISPLPVQQPIPIWFGGGAEATLRRIGRMGDGWIPLGDPNEETSEAMERVRNYAREAGRDPSALGFETSITIDGKDLNAAGDYIEAWRRIGGTHLVVSTMNCDLDSPGAHIEALRNFKEAVRF